MGSIVQTIRSVGSLVGGSRVAERWARLFGGPLGALLSRASRCMPRALLQRAEADPPDPLGSVAFTIAVIALGAKMAKADGTVSRDEVAAFREVFQVPASEEVHLRRVFDIARRSVVGFDHYARQVGRLFAGRRGLLEDVLGSLFYIALADGVLCTAEEAYLREVARHLGLTPGDYDRIRSAFVGTTSPSAEDPHVVLGISADASLDEIRAAYRRLVRTHHPDLVSARGMSAEHVALATARIARINEARDKLLRSRGSSAEAQPA
jgi:DnaJ like chaperone protein